MISIIVSTIALGLGVAALFTMGGDRDGLTAVLSGLSAVAWAVSIPMQPGVLSTSTAAMNVILFGFVSVTMLKMMRI